LDNSDIILQDARVHAVTSVQLHRILTQQYWETATTGLYRPLTTLSYLCNYTILGNGANPMGYHWINLGLHLINVTLVFTLGKAIFERVTFAFVLSALWGLHPVHTEAVTNIVGRADLLVALGTLAGLLCYRQALASTGARKAAWLGGLLVSATVGVFAKESGVAILGVILIYDLSIGRGEHWRGRVPGYLAAALPCAVYLIARARVLQDAPYLATSYCDNPLLSADFWTARLTALKVIGEYLLLLVWPAHLSYDYSYNQIPLVKTLAAMAPVLAGSILAIVLAIWSWRRHPIVCFGILWFAVTFGPTSNLIVLIGSIMGERFLYLPTVGLALCVVYVMHIWWEKSKTKGTRIAAMAVLGAVLLTCMARTYDRNDDWRDAHRFWQSGVTSAPGSYKTHLNVATTTAFLVAEDWDRAIHGADRALAILDPLPVQDSVGSAYRDAAMIFREVGEQVAQKQWAGTAAAGTTPAYWYQRALAAILRSEAIELAFDDRYRRENAKRGRLGLTALPSKLYLEMARTYLRLDRTADALRAFERGMALEAQPELLEEAAAAYERAGDWQSAAIALDESYTVDATRPVLDKLVELYQRIDPNGCAVTRQSHAAALNPDCPRLHADICLASRNISATYTRRGQAFEAAAVRQRAIGYLGCAPELVQ
jgi:hypothetical protein